MHFQLLDQSKGLSDEVNAHYQLDGSGLFWVSGRSGINRYDGKEVVTFRPNLLEESIDPNITSKIFEDASGRKWFSANNALICLPPPPDTAFYFQLECIKNSYYYAFHLERDSFLWLNTDGLLFVLPLYDLKPTLQARHDQTGFVIYPLLNEKKEVKGLIRPLIEQQQGIEVLKYLSDNSIQRDSFFITNNTSIDTFIFYLHIENDTSVWLPSSVGLIHFNPESQQTIGIYQHHENTPNLAYRDAFIHQQDSIWIVTEKGELLLFNKSKKEFTHYQNYFYVDDEVRLINEFNNLYIDSFHNLWLSSFREGVFHTNLRNTKFRQLLPNDYLVREEELRVNSIIANEDGSFLTSIVKKGVYQIVPGQYEQNYLQKIELECCEDENIYAIKGDRSGDIWILTNNAVWLWDKSADTFHKKRSAASYTFDIIELQRGIFLILERNNVYLINKDADFIENEKKASIFPDVNGAVEVFYDTLSHLVFLSQNNNVLRTFDAQLSWKEYSPIDNVGLINGFYRSAFQPIIWMASSTGLYQYFIEDHSIQRVVSTNGYLNNSFVDVVEDDKGYVWLSSYLGIFRYSPQNNTVDHFTESDGLITMHYKENVSLKGKNGLIYFGGTNGITQIAPESFHLNPNIPLITVLEATVNDSLISIDTFLNHQSYPRFHYKQNNLTFQFATIEYSDPRNNDFEALLINNQNDTIATYPSEFISLPNLTPGSYQIHCYAANSDKLKSKDAFILYFRIRLPWYATPIAIIAWILTGIATVFIWARFRILKIKKREETKRQIAEFKQKEAEYKQLIAETKTAVLRLQMNPHFIFNSMNSISSYISRHDIKTANNYLDRFSRLIRLILELSEHTFIDIEEEIEFLKLYLSTESMRVGQKLDYHIEVDEALEEDETLIPTMILQPFVENAIWHGISRKEEGGRLVIRFIAHNNQLLCEVEDNGVGREGAKLHNRQNHKSKAISITNKRLEFLAKEYPDFKTGVNIVDLKSHDQQPEGTKVQLFLPLF